MQHTLLFALVALALLHSSYGQGCTARAWLVERSGAWQEGGVQKRLFDLQITNTGTCIIGKSITVPIVVPKGSKIGYSWGYSNDVVSGFSELAPAQSHSGVGFIMSGPGTPTVSVTGFGYCSCAVDTTTTTGGSGTTGESTTTGTTTTTTGPTTPPFIPGRTISVGLKFLLLSCTATDVEVSAAKLVLNSVGAIYDQVIKANLGTANLTLTNSNISGKYYAIVSANELGTCWTTAQVAQIEAYERSFLVKTVILYTYPRVVNGVDVASIGPNSKDGNLTFADAMIPFATASKPDSKMPTTGIYMYPSVIFDPTMAVPAIYVTYADNTQFVAAAFINFRDGRKRLEFYIDQADWAIFVTLVGPSWMQWVTSGVFAGLRRIEFNCQVDDIYMATGMFDPETHEESETDLYRIVPSDIDQTVAWQRTLTARMPAGSRFVLTFPFNGATVKENGGYTVDALYIKTKAVRDEFYWESHTWDHPYLDNMTYAAVKKEFTDNNATALALFDNDLSNPFFCRHSCITPSISGLFNGNALRAMYDLGITNIVGDNSRPELRPNNVYHGWYTNVTSNGFAGIYVVPRHATDIYYDASLPEHIEELYDYVYNNSQNFDYIVAANTQVSANFLLAYRHDPFMFHQANLRSIQINGQTTALLQYWVDRVVDIVLQYSVLPLLSHSHDDLALMLQAREARDACGFAGTLTVDVDNKVFMGLHAESTGTCSFAVSGAVGPADVTTNEVVGPEKTMWIAMAPGTPKDITFVTHVPLS